MKDQESEIQSMALSAREIAWSIELMDDDAAAERVLEVAMLNYQNRYAENRKRWAKFWKHVAESRGISGKKLSVVEDIDGKVTLVVADPEAVKKPNDKLDMWIAREVLKPRENK